MARQKLGEKKTNMLRKQTGLDVVSALVRGGTDHRKDLLIEGGEVYHLYKDGTLEIGSIRWNQGR